jgi:frataxin-like iron-binding protein CyaY
MKNIKDLLLKYSNFGQKEKEQKNNIIEVFKKYRIDLNKKDIEIKNKILNIRIRGPQKTEVILNKRRILSEFNGEFLDIN